MADARTRGPALTNVFSLAGLDVVHFRAYRLRGGLAAAAPPDGPLAARLRFLEHGVGVEIAAIAAALAHVNESGAAMAAAAPDVSPDSSALLWVFTPAHDALDALHIHLAPLFDERRRGLWGSPTTIPETSPPHFDGPDAADPTVTAALLASVREFLSRALASRGFIRLRDEVILPSTSAAAARGTAAAVPMPQTPAASHFPPGSAHAAVAAAAANVAAATMASGHAHGAHRSSVAYRIVPFLTGAREGKLAVRVAARRIALAPVTDADLEAGVPLRVVTAPHASEAALVPHKIAGEGLAASVLARWREAGLVPLQAPLSFYDTQTAKAVVYVRDPELMTEVPVPRRCVLRVTQDHLPVHPAKPSPPHSTPASGQPQSAKHAQHHVTFAADFTRHAPAAQLLWRVRKRSRSPTSTSPVVESSADTAALAQKPELTPLPESALIAAARGQLAAPQTQAGRPGTLSGKATGNIMPAAAERAFGHARHSLAPGAMSNGAAAAYAPGAGRDAHATTSAASRDHGYDDISKLSELDELDKYFSVGDKGEKGKKKPPVAAPAVAPQVQTALRAAAKPEPMDVEKAMVRASSVGAAKRSAAASRASTSAQLEAELQSLYEEDLRARVSATFLLRERRPRSQIQRGQNLSLPPSSSIVMKKHGAQRARQALRSLYVPIRQVHKFVQTEHRTSAVPLAQLGQAETRFELEEAESSASSDFEDYEESDREIPDTAEEPEEKPAVRLPTPVAIDCASACSALRIFDRALSNVGEVLVDDRTPRTDVDTLKARLRTNGGALLALIDMQVLGNVDMWMSNPLKLAQKSGDEELKGPEIRRALFAFPRILQEAMSEFKINDVVSLSGPLTVESLPNRVIPLPAPRVCVGFRNDWIEAPMRLLPLWEKVGLSPFSGPKDLWYCVIAPRDKATDVNVFFRDLRSVYEECRFGSHAPYPHEAITYVGEVGTARETEEVLLERYRAAILGLVTKLVEAPPEPTSPRIVVYLVSPFPSARVEPNATLLRFLTPLVSFKNASNTPRTSAPWRPPGPGRASLPTVIKLVACDVLNQSFGSAANASDVPLRPQLIKAFANSVYNSMRGKHLRGVAEMSASNLGYAGNLSSELMSPVTPEQAITSPGAGTAQVSGPDNVDDMALYRASSVLYEPSFVLPGVGAHLGEEGASHEEQSMVFHICYSFSRKTMRFACAVTDWRGESLDFFTSPVLDLKNSEDRRKAFALMWNRGRRWWLTFVDKVRIVVAKVGEMEQAECKDWSALISDFLKHQGRDGKAAANVVCRSMTYGRGEETSSFFEKPVAPVGSPADGDSSGILGSPSVASVSIVTIEEGDGLLLLPRNSAGQDGCRQPLVIVCGHEGKTAQASAFMVDAGAQDTPVKISLLIHFGVPATGDKDVVGGDSSPWDGSSSTSVVAQIASNFHQLSALSMPPCGPVDRWYSKWPRHVQVVQNLQYMTSSLLPCDTKPS